MSAARVSVFCWRKANRHQKPLLSLMCSPPGNKQESVTLQSSGCHLQRCKTRLADNRLHTGLAQLRPISENEPMAQPPPSRVPTGAVVSIQLVWDSLKRLEPTSNNKKTKAFHRLGCQVDYQQREESVR